MHVSDPPRAQNSNKSKELKIIDKQLTPCSPDNKSRLVIDVLQKDAENQTMLQIRATFLKHPDSDLSLSFIRYNYFLIPTSMVIWYSDYKLTLKSVKNYL